MSVITSSPLLNASMHIKSVTCSTIACTLKVMFSSLNSLELIFEKSSTLFASVSKTSALN